MKEKFSKYFLGTKVVWIFVLLLLGGATVFADPPVDTPAANIVVAVDDSGSYEEGDIIVVANSKRALDVNAQNLMRPYDMPRTEAHTIVPGTLLEFYFEKTYQYKFQRISKNEVRRVNLWTGEEDIISAVPNSSGEYIDAPLFIKRRITLDPNGNVIFGNTGSEYWYGGNVGTTDIKLNQVWDEIERRTTHKRDYDFPFTETEKKHFLVMKVDDMTDEEVNDLASPLLDNQGNILKERKNKINLNAILSASERAALSDKSVSHDYRNRVINITPHIIAK